MTHSFEVEIAKEYGIQEAIIIQNLQFWILKNIANKKNLIDGRTWTYCSAKAFEELFPYMSTQSLRTTLKHLKERGVIITGNFNDNTHDRTLWYAFKDENKWIYQQTHLLKSTNGNVEINRPIPYSNTDNNSSNSLIINNNPIPTSPQSPKGGCESFSKEELIFEEFRLVYKGHRRGLKTEFANFKKKHKDWKEVLPILKETYEKQWAIKEEARNRDCFVPQEKNLSTYLNQRCWEEELNFENNERKYISDAERARRSYKELSGEICDFIANADLQ